MTAFTASVAGNWNNPATFGGAGIPVAGDTLTVNPNIQLRVPSGYSATCGATTLLAGTSGTTKIIVEDGGTHVWGGDITQNANCDYEPTGACVVDVKTFFLIGPNSGRSNFTVAGTDANHRAIIKSTSGAAQGGITAGSGQLVPTFSFARVQALGAVSFRTHGLTTVAPTYDSVQFVGLIGTFVGDSINSTAGIKGSRVSHCDFRDCNTANPAFQIARNGSLAAGETNQFTFNTCSNTDTSKPTIFKLTGTPTYIKDNIFARGALFDTCTEPTQLWRNFIYPSSASLALGGAGAIFTQAMCPPDVQENYIYYPYGNHLFNGGSTASYTFNYNIWEAGGYAISAGANVYVSDSAANIYTQLMKFNIFIGAGTVLLDSGHASNLLLFQADNNTLLIDNHSAVGNPYLAPFHTERNGTLGLNYFLRNNLLVGRDSVRDELIFLQSGQGSDTPNAQIGPPANVDFNFGWSLYTNAPQIPPVGYGLPTDGGIDMSAWGYGAHDGSVNPQFRRADTGLARCDALNGGPGTVDNYVAELLNINDYSGTYKPAYSLENLKAQIRSDLTPQNKALQGVGLGGADIGAVAVVLVKASGRTRFGTLGAGFGR